MLLEYPCAMQRRNIYRRRTGNRCKYIFAISIAFQLYTSVLSAPASFDSLLPQSSEIAEYFSDISGCYYNFQRYDEGDRIVTNEPCLNCTCHNRMLMCYLRVCPFTKAIGQDCTIEKKPDQCCPIITCPEVPVKLLTSSTTSSPTPAIQTTEIGFHDNFGCSIHDSFYADGAQVPPDPRKPCELCYCIRNRTACVMQECTLHVEGCKPVYQDGICCPVRYDCDYEKVVTSTTRLQTSGGVIKSTTYATVVDCQYKNQSYSDGELITTDKPCEHCYCMRGDIVCAVQDCGEPLRGKDCVPTTPPPERCCPSSYDCTNDVQATENATKGFVTSETELPPRFSASDKPVEYETTTKSNRSPVTLSQEEIIYQKLGENNISTLSGTSHFEKVNNETSTQPGAPSQHPSETIESDGNAFDSIERFTTSARPSGTTYEIVESATTTTPTVISPAAGAAAVEYADTQRPNINTDQRNTTKLQTSESEFPQEELTTSHLEESNLSTTTEEHVKVTSDIYGDRTSSPAHVSAAITTSTYPKLQETATKFVANDDIEVVSKDTDTVLLEDNPTTTGEIDSVEKSTANAVYETTVNTSTSYSSEPNRYSSTASTDETTVVDENGINAHFSSATQVDDRATEKISAAADSENEKATENINTVSDKNTEPSNDQLAEKEQENTTALPTIAAVTNQRITIKYPVAAETETKPESVPERINVSAVPTTLEYEKDSATVATFVGVPGEGSCLVDGITYHNMSVIESSNPCHSECICLSSIPTCTLVKCNPPPSDPKCMPIQVKPDSCCPIYVCGGDESVPAVQTISSDNHIASADSLYPVEEKLTTTTPSSPILSERNATEHPAFDAKNRSSPAFLLTVGSTSGIETVDLTSPSSASHSKVTAEIHKIKPPASPEQNDIVADDNDDDGDNGNVLSTTISSNSIKLTVNTNVPLNQNKGSSITAKPEYSIDQTTNVVPHLSEAPLEDETSTFSHNHELQQPQGAVSDESGLSTGESTSSTSIQNNEPESPSSVGLEKETIGVIESTSIENNEILQGSGAAISSEKYSTSSESPFTTKEAAAEIDSSTMHNDLSSAAVDDEPANVDQNVPDSPSQANSQNTNESNKIVYTTVPPNRETTYDTDHSIAVEQNNGISITTGSSVAEYESEVTTAAVTSSSTLTNNKQAQTLSSFIMTTKPDAENEINEGETSNASTNEQADTGEVPYSTFSPYDGTGSQSTPSSSFITTSVTPALIKSTERGSSDDTEVDEIVTSTAPSLPSETYLPDSGINANTEISKPWSSVEDATTSHSSTSSSLLPADQSNDISSTDPEELTHKFGTTEPPIDNSLPSEHSHLDETTPQQQFITTTSFPIENIDVSSVSSQSSSTSEVDSIAHTIPVTTSVPEYGVKTTKIPENNDIAQSEIVISEQPPFTHFISPITSEKPDNYPSATITSSSSSLETKFSSTEKSAAELASSPGTLSESNFTPIQHSTWTRKPIEEEVTSEASYYPQAPMYPPGIDSGGNFEGLGMEEYDENSGAFGPGTCRYAGKVYVSAQQIPRDDPCDFCFCFRSDIICLQQSCPPPIHGCRQEPIQGFCCPRYECPVAGYPPSNATTSTTTTTTTTTTTIPSRLAPRFPLESYRGSVRKMGCVIHGYFYNVGDDIAIASGPCLECLCGTDGRMKCDPKSCSPEPYARQMMMKSTFNR